MSYINLIEKRDAGDKKKLHNYLTTYGIQEKNFIGVDEWLENWSHSNQKLYKLLGGKFIHKIDSTFAKGENELYKEVDEMLDRYGQHKDFRDNYGAFYQWIKEKADDAEWNLELDHLRFFNHITDSVNFVTNQLGYSLKYKKPGAARMLQIPPDMKPLRAIQKIADYFKNDFAWNHNAIERLRLKHSMIFNDKKVKGSLCFSIHPLDFITMSDNSSNWTSCMSWTGEGCYHAGTVEMMNSNNVIVCYLEMGGDKYYFATPRISEKLSEEEKADWSWNNKKWRILAYITKDIIMAGKAYPYRNDEFSKAVLDELKDLAEKNLGWTYSFGPELYKDMIHVNSEYPFERVREWRMHGELTKHNILWDTNGMYNDMLNDHNTKYWCYRNKVEHTKIIKVSGKCNCLSCNGPALYYEGGCDYNDRYMGASSLVCDPCLVGTRCSVCGALNPKMPTYKIKVNGMDRWCVCEFCMEKSLKICPDCGKIMFLDYPHSGPRFIDKLDVKTAQRDDWVYYDYYLHEQNLI